MIGTYLYRESFCDQCMSNDSNGDYSEPLHYDKENRNFKCSEGHIEDFHQYFRHDSKESLIETIKELLNREESE